MQLNVIQQTAVVKAACAAGKITDVNPRFGTAMGITDEVFKYMAPGDLSRALIIHRVSLAELFDGIPQDITGLTFAEPVEADLSAFYEKTGIDTTVQEYPLQNATGEAPDGDDPLGIHFIRWKRLVGLGSLTRGEVELSLLDDNMIIQARYSAVYCGSVAVKIQ